MLFFRYAVGYNAGTGADEHFSVFLKRKPDCDAGVHISGEIQIADRTAVNAALVVFQLIDDLAGTELWCTGEGSGREERNRWHRLRSCLSEAVLLQWNRCA